MSTPSDLSSGPCYVTVDFLNVSGTIGPSPIPVKGGMDVLITR